MSRIKEVQIFNQEERESRRVHQSAWDYTTGILALLKKSVKLSSGQKQHLAITRTLLCQAHFNYG